MGLVLIMKYNSHLLGATVYPEHKTILFYGGIFSQWAEADFNIQIGDHFYKVNCAEQAMMLKKAEISGDEETFDRIRKATHPSEQKKLGRMVKNFNPEYWSQISLDWVTRVNVEKFSQNAAWRELLLLTDPYELVEASPTDRIWGIGYGEENPIVFEEKDKWGQNLLGVALMTTRDVLLGRDTSVEFKGEGGIVDILRDIETKI